MPLYKYDATDIAGKRRSGELQAYSEGDARKSLGRRSFTDIQLEEQAPPKPPMALHKKLLLSALLVSLLGGTGLLIMSSVLAPPDMPVVYEQWDDAVKFNDFEGQFKHFEKPYIWESGGKYRKVDRDAARERLRTRVEKEGLVRTRKTTVEGIKKNGNIVLVPISVSTFIGKKGTLNSETSTSRVVHVWKRQGLSWQIYLVKQLPPTKK
jgi:ketosteroid isomerase-like protein